MHEWLIWFSEPAVVVIDLMALVVLVAGTVIAFVEAVRVAFKRNVSGHEYRQIWLKFARWLVAGLTFQLAADIIESAIAQNWDSIGRLAAIAVVRTFLDYFLGRDTSEVRDREREHIAKATPLE